MFTAHPQAQSVPCLTLHPTLHPWPVLPLTKGLWILGVAKRDILGRNIRISQTYSDVSVVCSPTSSFLSCSFYVLETLMVYFINFSHLYLNPLNSS